MKRSNERFFKKNQIIYFHIYPGKFYPALTGSKPDWFNNQWGDEQNPH